MKREQLSLSKIILSSENPRLDISFSEEETIYRMIEDQKDKLIELASDIISHGLNPLESVAVFPSDLYPGYYEVAEGNRRVCALKLLENPDRVGTQYAGLRTKMEQLSQNYSVPPQLEVVVFENEQAVRHWMEIRHMGEQGGKGLSKWNSVQKMRFQKKQTGADALLDFWTWMDQNNILSMRQIREVTKTNWQRVLRDTYFPFLRIQYDGKYSVRPDDLQVFTNRIRELQRRLAGQTVGIVYDQQRIEEFYNKLSQDMYGIPYADVLENEYAAPQIKIEDLSNADPVNLENDDQNGQVLPSSMTADNTDKADDPADISIQATAPVRDVFSGCKTIIPYSYGIRSSNMRVNKIIQELKTLNPDEYPNACGTLLRALFELSAKVFLEKQSGGDKTSMEFQPAIKNAANELRNQGKISNEQHSAILKDVDSLRSIFNGYMHKTDVYPSSMAMKNLLKAHIVFLMECLK